jgi:hypothetical protein
MKHREEIFNFNRGQLKIFSYIIEEPKSGKKRFEGCFQALKFNLSEEECHEVAAVAFRMTKEDIRSFIFLSNYLLLSCKNLEKKGVSLVEIQKRLSEII